MKKFYASFLLGAFSILSTSSFAQESVVVTNDTYILWTSSKTDNFGSDERLMVRFSQDGPYRRDIFLKFDLSSATTPAPYDKVNLKIYGNDEGLVGIPLRVLKIAPDRANFNWSENSLIFSNKPATDYTNDNIAEIETEGDGDNKFFEWDITSWVNEQAAAGQKIISLHLRQMSIPGTGGVAVDPMYFHSKENPSGNKPSIILHAMGNSIEANSVNRAEVSVYDGILSANLNNSDAETLSIYSLNGVKVFETEISGQASIDVSNISGLHIVKLADYRKVVLF